MNLIEEVGKTVWISNWNIVYYNLPLCIIQHWIYLHELNITLIELVKYLAIEYRVLKQPLDLLVSLYTYKNEIEKNHKMDVSMNEIDKLLLKIYQWIKVPKGYDSYQIKKKQLIKKKYYNQYALLQNILEDEDNYYQKY